jgi:hypothetical protein
MNKRQIKKKLKKENEIILAIMDEERKYCGECGKRLDLENNTYHKRYGMCDSTCYLHNVGMSWSDFL